jgi:hypothetical protein
VPQVFDLWQDPQERYDIFMNNYTERTWTLVTISEAIKTLMNTYVQYPPRKLQSESTPARSRSRSTSVSNMCGKCSLRRASAFQCPVGTDVRTPEKHLRSRHSDNGVPALLEHQGALPLPRCQLAFRFSTARTM